MNDCMTFPDTVEEFMEQYKVVDTEHIYTNGTEFVPIFRMKQWFKHLPSIQPDTTTHDSIPAETGGNYGDRTSGDCISRQQAFDALHCRFADGFEEDRWWNSTHVIAALKGLPAVPPERKGTRLSTVCLLCKKPAVTFNTEDDIPYTNYSYCEDCLRKGLKLLREQNKNLQTQPERKTGRWIPDNTDYYRTKFICSVCGESEEVPTTGFGYGTMWGYCPNCGADMKGDKHETN